MHIVATVNVLVAKVMFSWTASSGCGLLKKSAEGRNNGRHIAEDFFLHGTLSLPQPHLSLSIGFQTNHPTLRICCIALMVSKKFLQPKFLF
jgi:hypothetical protein